MPTLSLFTLPFLFYRLEDLVAHDDIISIITKLIDSDNLPHLLFYGPPGTGKVQLTDLFTRYPRLLYLSLN
jgi:replication-associated recombination protein RarA